jgi:cytochrome oxidase Cu insertion factor (SCO1/SenC/PrrC family)
MLVGSVVLGCNSGPESLGAVGDFTLTDQLNRTVTKADLVGKVWVASFVFTRCTTLCPQVSCSMAHLQGDLAAEPGVVLVSFSVDPSHDTPAVLKQYAASFQADPGRWRFLSGDQKQVYELIEKSFHLGVQQNSGSNRTPGNEVTHSSKLAVVDRRGQVRGYFDGQRVDATGKPINELPRLEELVRILLREKA